jgi:radical SAM-linked protein
MEKTRLRIRFTKAGDLRWISHRDLARVWERLLRRADLQLAFSEGFHPKPKISFPSALALGIEALEEIVELEVLGEMAVDEIEKRIREQVPAGMDLLSVESPTYKLGKAKVDFVTYEIDVPEAQQEELSKRLEELAGQDRMSLQRDKKQIECDLKHPKFAIGLEDGKLFFSLPTLNGPAIRPSELLEQIGLGELLESGQTLRRTHVELLEPATTPEQ